MDDQNHTDVTAAPPQLSEHTPTHMQAIRDLVQNIRNRNDPDNNRILDNIGRELDAIDGNPKVREEERLEAEQIKAHAEKRAAEAQDKRSADTKAAAIEA